MIDTAIRWFCEQYIVHILTHGGLMNASAIMRLVATVCFVLAIFGVPWPWQQELCFGLALWCGASLVP